MYSLLILFMTVLDNIKILTINAEYVANAAWGIVVTTAKIRWLSVPPDTKLNPLLAIQMQKEYLMCQ